MHFLPATLLGLLAFAPPEQDPQANLAELESLVENLANADRKSTIVSLEDRLARAARSPDAAPEDNTVPDVVLRGWLVLTGLHLAEGDKAAAANAMDQLIRTARAQEPPVRDYGPRVLQLYDSRKPELQAGGMATIEVDCEVDCNVIISHRLLPGRSEQLLLGTYQVWIKATDGAAEWEFHEVTLASAGATERVAYDDPTPEPEPVPRDQPQKLPRKRLLPRGAEIAGMAVGIGMVVAGALLLSFEGKCTVTQQPPTPESNGETCGSLYRTIPAGASLVGIGGGLLIVSGVMLSVDEVRVGRAKAQQVMIGVSLRF
jgi:hypothetical protein